MVCRLVVRDLREDKGTVHDLLLRKSFVAIAATDWITGVVSTTALFAGYLVLHLAAEHTFVWRN